MAVLEDTKPAACSHTFMYFPIYVDWILQPALFGAVHFQFKGYLVSLYYDHVLLKCM